MSTVTKAGVWLRTTALVLLAVTALAVVACGGQVSREAFARIENGMTMDEVVAILGEPTETSSIDIGPLSGTSAQWVARDLRIDIQFFNDKVRLKTLQDR